jgi:hypothetical protein
MVEDDMSQHPFDADAAKRAMLRRLDPDSLRAGGPELRRVWRRGTAAAAAAALAGGFLIGGFVAARYEGRLGKIHRETSALREEIRREESALHQRAILYQSVVDLLRDPATRVVTLRGPGPGAQGRVVWHDTEGGHLFLTKLPPAPEGTAYALWAISAGRPRPAGLFQPDEAGQATQRVAPVGRPVDAFTVTLESVGGAPAPTGRVVLGSGPALPVGAARLGSDRAPSTVQPVQVRDDEGQRPQPEQGSGEQPADEDRPAPSGG